MDLESWTQIAEILATVAVLVSLWFLVIQLRQSLAQSKKQALDDLALSRTEFLKVLYEDHDLASLIWRGLSLESKLPTHEWGRFGTYLYSSLVIFELTHAKYLANDIGEENWNALLGAYHWFLQTPGARAWWAAEPIGFTPAFIAMVNEEMGKLKENDRFVRPVGKSFAEADMTSSQKKAEHSDDAASPVFES